MNAKTHRAVSIAIALAMAAIPETGAARAPKAPPPLPTAAPPAKAAPQPPAPAAKASVVSIEPTWPAPFDLLDGEIADWRFVVGQPGPVSVSVRSKGEAITVTLRRPDGMTLDRTGTGEIALAASATPADVQRGVLWSLNVHGAAPPPPRDGKPRRLAPVASGTITVIHPPGDPARAEAEVKALSAQAQTQRAQASAKTKGAPSADLAARRRAELGQQNAARQAQMLAQLRSRIPADAFQRVNARIQSGAVASAKPMAPVTSRAAPSAVPHGTPGTTPATPMQTQSLVATSPPAIQSLSVTEGQPGDPVLVTGTGFGDVPGELHFVVAPGKDLVAPCALWSNGQILAEVPYLDGVRDYGGFTYVTRSDGVKSGLLPFRFHPPMDVYVLGPPVRNESFFDGHAPGAYHPSDKGFHHPDNVALQFLWYVGGKGDDEMYMQTRLTNGWVVDSAELQWDGVPGPYVFLTGFASISDFRPGTESPYVKIHWWYGAISQVVYTVAITVRGPRCLSPTTPNPLTDGPMYACTPHTP